MMRMALITGGSSGIGQAIVSELRLQGWHVIAPSHTELDLADLSKVESYATDHLADKEVQAFIHVAAIWHDAEKALAAMGFDSFTTDQVVDTMNVGLVSPMLLVNALLKNGSLRQVIGVSGTFEDGAAGWLPYYTSKRALEDFLVGLAHDKSDIKVFGISPSDTATEVYQRFFPEYAASAQKPEVVAQLVRELLEGKAAYASGSMITLKDGMPEAGFHA